jgi:copper(I)-binding protein
MTLLRNALALLTLLAAAPTLAGEPALLVHDPWVAEAPPVASAVGAFMGIENRGETPRALVEVSSPAAERAEMHRTVISEGMARMVPQERIEVPAGDQVTLEPGSYHIMLIRPTRPLKAGDRVALRLTFDDGSVQDVEAEVRKRTGGGHHHHHHH